MAREITQDFWPGRPSSAYINDKDLRGQNALTNFCNSACLQTDVHISWYPTTCYSNDYINL